MPCLLLYSRLCPLAADAGKNATVFGPGVYFARDASYSARDTYSPPDGEGLKRVFLCRLAIGAHVQVPTAETSPTKRALTSHPDMSAWR